MKVWVIIIGAAAIGGTVARAGYLVPGFVIFGLGVVWAWRS